MSVHRSFNLPSIGPFSRLNSSISINSVIGTFEEEILLFFSCYDLHALDISYVIIVVSFK